MVVLTIKTNFQKLAVDIAKTWNNFMAAKLLWTKLQILLYRHILWPETITDN